MLTVDETALLCWRLLETQGKCGCTWETFKEVPDELKQIVPVERRLCEVRKADGCVVRMQYREYTENAANRALSSLGFDIIAALNVGGYRNAFRNFTGAVRAYYFDRRMQRLYAR